MTLKVLIAEDVPDIANVVAFGVRMTWPGCRVLLAADGAHALRCFAEEQPDLVILDVTMPPPDGCAVLQHMRERSQVPILMLTVCDGIMDKMRALDLGADDYLSKPLTTRYILTERHGLSLRRAALTAYRASQGGSGCVLRLRVGHTAPCATHPVAQIPGAPGSRAASFTDPLPNVY